MPSEANSSLNKGELKSIQAELLNLRQHALDLETKFLADCVQIPAPNDASARNLLHYLGIRQHDIRSLQRRLTQQGLSSLGTIEPCTLSHLNTLLNCLASLTGDPVSSLPPPVDFLTGPETLREHAESLLGPDHEQLVRIMVTMPPEAADDPGLLERLLAAGMNVMRINCAHDNPQRWRAMVCNLRQAEKKLNKRCKVQMDLAGPKLRTGSIASVGQVLKIKPQRDEFGRVTTPALIWLTDSKAPVAPPKANDTVTELQITQSFLQQCKYHTTLTCRDARGRQRTFQIVEFSEKGCLLTLDRTAYLTPETPLILPQPTDIEGKLSNIPEYAPPIELAKNDTLILTRQPIPGARAEYNTQGEMITPAHIHCTLPQAFEHAKINDRVWLDDGQIGAVITSVDPNEIELKITHAKVTGSKLKAEKGINFPDSAIPIPALTIKDQNDLAAVVELADIVALSFVSCASDVDALHQKLQLLNHETMGVVLKIENKQAFQNLPKILLTALKYPNPVGVMVARGDLAVEIGFERLSEVQQEILWLCEAAHIPVIWATQILESMTKTGLPSRAEVSDAAMSVFAECAMLNKGNYIVEAVAMLKNIILRMDQHYLKRKTRLRRLAVADID